MIFSNEIFFQKDYDNFWHRKMTLNVRILQFGGSNNFDQKCSTKFTVAICFSDPKYDLNSSIQEFPKNSSRFPQLFIFLWQMAKEFSKNLEEFQHEKVDGLKFSFNCTYRRLIFRPRSLFLMKNLWKWLTSKVQYIYQDSKLLKP